MRATLSFQDGVLVNKSYYGSAYFKLWSPSRICDLIHFLAFCDGVHEATETIGK